MNLIKKPNELPSKTILKGLIYGQPGIGKTTLALSAPKPLLIDFDKGLYRVAKEYQCDSVQVTSYQDLLDVLKEPLSEYNTLVIDTIGKMVDRIGDYAAMTNPKLKQLDGTLSMKGWGQIKSLFQALLSLLEAKGKSVIFVSHESEEKDGDATKKRPDCSGSARKDIIKELDFMGYMSMYGSKRAIDLCPNESYYAKNSLGIDGYLEVPKINGENDFLKKNIFDFSEKKAESDNELSEKYELLKSLIEERIENIITLDMANQYYTDELGKLERVWSSFEYEKVTLWNRAKTLGLSFDKQKNIFIKNEQISNNANAS